MVSISQYGEREVKACKSVLLELVHLLGEIKDEMVIIGGWAPTFLLPQSDDPHVGSLDIDVALDFSKIPDNTYHTILKAFLKRGYTQDKDQPFRFFRKVKVEGVFQTDAFQSDAFQMPINVEVDLMAGEYGGTAKAHRTQKIQDVRARKARGCDLAFDSSITVTLEGDLPDGGKDKVNFKVVGIAPFLVMKGMAMFERMKEKDAYDIYYCVEHYPGGVEGFAAEFRPQIKNKLIIEGLEKIRSKFASIEHIGPKWVADFLEVTDKEDRAIIMRRVYEEISELLDILKISSWEEKA
ncbi:MAG TPA: hypothetical protein DHU69_08590 [Deltaproteobacteria bacterium]|nr:MAG: hypothetical protein A2067_01560 [Deltaproteobacteria bacterium GWB2_42_7]OGP49000.1 MAG: hypothetical protein A2022_06700 [Deltaproteobacteria bacterium GWF2_42_12]OGQ25642.1 MAG: hypothetical protein A3D29_06975 [Deltaproteobacteria bacterium RIFCSPHIGHO2_02_FULL_42_44]OGQ37418.1 MAG: hypothetical protein A3H47_05315 [Deltaproteobacteria bacterium RIFCSPLOWO2_02_FULL_42_39]OGQ66902.1 MAG: hypothetical protein A3F88_01710 [Deltaproteobacteria bacterium RIFCSPLOWO2_12_FULL_42_16]OGQ755